MAALLIILNIKPILNGLGFFLRLFVPFVAGIAIAFILNRPCMRIEGLLAHTKLKKHKKVSKGIAVAVTYILGLLFFTILIIFIIPQVIKSITILISNIGQYFNNLQGLLNDFSAFLDAENIDLSKVLSQILQSVSQLEEGVTKGVSQVINFGVGVFLYIFRVVLALVFSVYLLACKERVLKQVKRVSRTYLSERIYAKGSYVYHVVVDVFNQYVVGQLLEASILGALTFIGMLILRLDYPLLISVIVGLSALVPYIGAYIGGAIAFLLLLMISPLKAVMFIIFIVILQQFEGGVIYPRVVGSRLGVPGIWVFLAATIGGGLGGPLGILLGVPIVTVIYTLIKNDIEDKAKARKEEKIVE